MELVGILRTVGILRNINKYYIVLYCIGKAQNSEDLCRDVVHHNSDERSILCSHYVPLMI